MMSRGWSRKPRTGSSSRECSRLGPTSSARPRRRSSRPARPSGSVLGELPADLFTRRDGPDRRGPRAAAQGANAAPQLGALRPGRRASPTGRPSKSSCGSAASGRSLAREASSEELQALRAELEKPFADRLMLWQKTKNDLVAEMDSAIQMPGWGNIFTQPIINRIEMLSTGVRSQIGVKIFGDDLGKIQRVSQEVAGVLRAVPGAANVVPDQIVGKGYVEIKIDRKKAARYGVSVGDIQDVVEVAMGGKPLTMTVEKRERYPVRVRYARAFRDDVEALKRILVSARCPDGRRGRRRGGRHGRDGRRAAAARRRRARRPAPGAARRRGRRQGGRGALDDQERERPAARLRPAHRPRPRRDRLRRGGQAGRGPEGQAPAGHVHRVVRPVRAPGAGPADAAARLPGRHRRDRPDPLPDLPQRGRHRC